MCLCQVTFGVQVTILEIFYAENAENIFISALLFCMVPSNGLTRTMNVHGTL